MRDLTPGEMARFRRVERAFLATCGGWGYQEVRTPTIEFLHLFTRAGTLSPQMLQRVYSFLDWDGWSGERVVLRPDATIPVVRLHAEALADQPVAKLCYVENVFRFAPNDDPRESWQCGAEVIGEAWPEADLELILMALEVLASLGAGPVDVRLSHTGVIRTLLARTGYSLQEQADLYDRILDGDAAAYGEIQARLPELDAPLHLLLDLAGGAGYLANVRSAFLPRVPELAGPLEELALVGGALDGLGVPYTVSMALARNFEYYTGPVFQLEVGGARLGGGGRYDALAALVGGRAAPATGFMLDMHALLRLLPEEPAGGPRAVAVRAEPASPGALAAAFALARAARAAGLAVRTGGADGAAWSATAEETASGVRYRLRGPDGAARDAASVEEALRLLEGAG
ncbi:MAG TPA: ATP phosphoribosyltransferase regulatory subunit [Dehalococcoidia bacterium]